MFSPKRRMCRVFLCFAALAALTAAGCKRDDKEASGENASTVPRASIVLVKRAPISSTLLVAGEFIPLQEVELHAKVAGYIRHISVDIGDKIHTGEVLATLEIPELTAQVTGADAGVRHSQQEIGLSKSEVARAEANHVALHSAAERLKQAAASRPGMIAQQELDDAEAKDSAAEAQVSVAKAGVSASEQQLDVSKADRMHYSSLADYSRITAPFDGIVTWRYADTGALIQAGTSNAGSMPVVKVAQVSTLRLRIPVPENLSGYIRDGDLADIRVQATGEQFRGKILRTTGSLDNTTRSLQVEIDIPNPNMKLIPGMYADVTLHLQGNPDALTVAVQAINHEDTQTTALVVNTNNIVERRVVKVGLEAPNDVEILSGLREGERVIIGNPSTFQPGEKVDPRQSVMANASDTGKGN